MNVFRPAKPEMTTITVDLTKKPGKGLGLSIMSKKKGSGVYIYEIVSPEQSIRILILLIVAFVPAKRKQRWRRRAANAGRYDRVRERPASGEVVGGGNRGVAQDLSRSRRPQTQQTQTHLQ